MALPTVFDLCRPRQDVLAGTITESDFAADLAQVIRGTAPKEYAESFRFFATTYPTRGLRNLLSNVCRRLSGAGGEVASIFRLDTQFGGGKTHGLIALVHAAGGMQGVENAAEFVDPELLPAPGTVRIAAFDGENADPANGRTLEEGIRAYTPWGEIAYALAGRDGFERVRVSDEQRVAPGAETIRELFQAAPGAGPVLLLMDELAIYLRKVKQPDARRQMSAFLSALFKAVESTPNTAVVYTLAVGKDGRATDAYSEENQSIADSMAEAESISARKATLLNPTEEDETVKVLRRRLFERIDDAGAQPVVEAYRGLWHAHRESLSDEAGRAATVDAFREGYPLHPEVLETLTTKTATLQNFQRVRGMLRLLARTIAEVWQEKPADALAIHLHHLNPGNELIRQEIVTRLGQAAYVPAIRADVATIEGGKRALAQQLDQSHYRGMAPYGSYVARTIFMHSLAFNEQLKGVKPEDLRYSVLGPSTDISFIEDARKRFRGDSAYLDDRPGAPLRFQVEANLTQVIRRQEQEVDPGEVRAQLNDRIREIFKGKMFDLVPFPGGEYEVPDEVGNGPLLVVLGYDAATVGPQLDSIPELARRIYKHKGSDGKTRLYRNHLVFVVADEQRKEEMRRKMIRRLALYSLKQPERLGDLAEHQQQKVRELEAKSEQEVAVAIQQCYRHIFYPSAARLEGADVELAHTAVEIQSASANPGSGQAQVVRALRDNNKLRAGDDEPDSPAYIRDRTPLRKGQITTAALRDEFRRDPKLPILMDDDIFRRAIRRGVEQGEYVYQRDELLYGPGDPVASIAIDEQAVVSTMSFAREHGIWPRPEPKPEPSTPYPPHESNKSEGHEPKPGPGPSPTPPPLPPPGALEEEGVLKEALTKLWEKARSRKLKQISLLRIRIFDPGDAFRVLGAAGTIPATEKRVKIEGEYETREGASLELKFGGPVTEAQPLKEFLEPQLRAAADKVFNVVFDFHFADGLALGGEMPEKLSERLTRFATGAAYVMASAEGE